MAEKTTETPQPKRRLGLGLRKGASTTPGVRRQIAKTNTPLTESHKKTALATETLETPRVGPLRPKASSTNCRRLGLSRRHKDIRKKRLEFATVSDKSEETATQSNPTSKKAESAEATDWRQRKIEELEKDIDTWKNGFIAAIDDLQAMVEPRLSKETLLTQLGIPLEMLQYLDED